MADFTAIKATINAQIKQNGQGDITGDILNGVLNGMIDAVNQKKVDPEALDRKANKDGYYEQMGVGVADNLAGKGDGVPAEFTRRPTGGTADVADGVATLKAIRGNSIVWNQLKASTSGVAQLAGSYFNVFNITAPVEHKLFITFKLQEDGGLCKMVGVQNGTYREINIYPTNGVYRFCDVIGGYQGVIYVRAYNVTAQSLHYNNAQIYDLTKMGIADRISTSDEFKALFPKDDYPYNEGELLSLNMEGVRTDGFNQWDEEYGNTASLYGYGVWGSKTLISVIPNQAYFFKNEDNKIAFFRIYDNAMNVIADNVRMDATPYTMPVNAAYAIFYLYQTNAGYYGKSCINLSHSGVRNGEYEPYWSQERSIPVTSIKGKVNGQGTSEVIFPNGMRSAGSVHDEIVGNKATKRCGKRAYQAGDENNSTLVTDKADTIYPLATPVEYIIDEDDVPNYNYKVSDFGTETLIPEGVDAQGTPKSSPLLAQIVYGMNAVDFIRNAPKNYISKESMDSILTALKTAGVISDYTLTWDAANGKYNCSITA